MREITYRRTELDNESVQHLCSSLIELIYNIVGLTECGILPPFETLNRKLLSGGECNPFGNVDWEPFEIGREEYDDLCEELEKVDPADIPAHRGYVFARMRRATEFDDIKDDLLWSRTVNEKYVDEWVNKLNRLNTIEAENDAEDWRSSEPPPQAPDLENVESTLFDLASTAIREFFSKSSQTYYGFGFDCNAAYGDVLLCTNTESDFKETADKYIEDWNYSDEELASLKRNFGDWRYQGFNIDYPFWQKGWDSLATEIATYVFHDQTSDDESEQFVERLMVSFAAVLIRLEQSGELDVIQKDPDFYIQVYDHDEDPKTGDKRFQAVRKKLKMSDKEDGK